jgi:molybdopterin molybdotransferase
VGSVLADDVTSDSDSPPFAKAMMDGYAASAGAHVRQPVSAGPSPDRVRLRIIEEISAGQVAKKTVGPGEAARIMTGAPIPPGADLVVMQEQTKLLAPDLVEIDAAELVKGRNVLERGTEMRRGEVVLSAGTVLRPQHLGILAGMGRASLRLFPRPHVSVLSTGDEVVEAGEPLGAGQIHNSNGPMLVSQANAAAGIVQYLGIARDEPNQLRDMIGRGLKHDILVLSGGVSAGKRDLVPGVLEELGVRARFHKVRMKPGKPVFFGVRDHTLVFGLPGNPVSAFVCFNLFVRPAMDALTGHPSPGPRTIGAEFTDELIFETDRPTYHPAKIEELSGRLRVRLVKWFGSADLRGLGRADALVLMPAGRTMLSPGSQVQVIALDR